MKFITVILPLNKNWFTLAIQGRQNYRMPNNELYLLRHTIPNLSPPLSLFLFFIFIVSFRKKSYLTASNISKNIQGQEKLLTYGRSHLPERHGELRQLASMDGLKNALVMDLVGHKTITNGAAVRDRFVTGLLYPGKF